MAAPGLPSVIRLEPVPCLGPNGPDGPQGPAASKVAWRVTAGRTVRRDSEMRPLFGLGDGAMCVASSDMVACVACEATDRIHVRLLNVPAKFVADPPVALIDFAVFDGVGCDATLVFKGTLAPTATGIQDLVQVSGLLSTHWQLWAAASEELDEDPRLEFDILADREGPPYQIRWGWAVTKSFPAPAGSVFNTLPL